MEFDEIKEVYDEVHDLHDKVFSFVQRLVKICRMYNYMTYSDYTGKIMLSGFKCVVTPSISNSGTKFILKYNKKTLINFRFFIKKYEDAESKVAIYTDGHYIDMTNLGLIKDFAAEIKKEIEVMNISLGEII